MKATLFSVPPPPLLLQFPREAIVEPACFKCLKIYVPNVIRNVLQPEFDVVDPVEVERGDGVEEDGGGDVRLTCNELYVETFNFPQKTSNARSVSRNRFYT